MSAPPPKKRSPRLPPFSRAQSTPTLPHHHRPHGPAPRSYPTSSSSYFAPPPPPPGEALALATLPYPVLVFEPSLHLFSINTKAREAFGLPPPPPSPSSSSSSPQSESLSAAAKLTTTPGSPAPASFDSHRSLGLGPGGAEQFIWTSGLAVTALDGGGEGGRGGVARDSGDLIREELRRLSLLTREREWGSRADGDHVDSWLALKSGSVPGLKWFAEVRVTAFEAPIVTSWPGGVVPTGLGVDGGASTWYSVLLVRTLPREPTRSDGGIRSGSNRSMGSAAKDGFGSQQWQQHEMLESEFTMLGGLSRPPVRRMDASAGSEGSWSHVVPREESQLPSSPLSHPQSGSPFIPIPPSPPSSVPSSSISTPSLAPHPSPSSSISAGSRPFLPLRMPSALPPATPPLSSAGSRLSDRIYSSSSSGRNPSVVLQQQQHQAALEQARSTITTGVTVSSAGIHIAKSVPVPPSPETSDAPFTSVPPPPPATKPLTPSHQQLLQFAALSNLPQTGVIVADTTLSSGYVNALARSLLMGAPLPRNGVDNDQLDPLGDDEKWWEDGVWSTAEFPDDGTGGGGPNSASSSLFSSSASAAAPGGRAETNPFDFTAKDLTHSAIIQAGEAKIVDKSRGSGGTSIRVGKPSETNRYRTTVASILARSARPASLKRSESDRAGLSSSTSSMSSSNVSRKPYKMYDATFSQRIIDPLEPLLEICARRGEQPSAFDPNREGGGGEGGAVSGMIVGIEVEVESNDDAGLFQNSKRKTVRRRLVEVSGAPIIVGGIHLGGILLLRDVTDKGTVEKPSQRPKAIGGEAYFKHILDHMPQMVWTTTPLGSHDFFNCQWYDYTGLEPEQSLGLGWQNPFHEDDMPHTVKAWSHSLETGDPYTVEYRCRRHDGAWRWMLGRALPFRDESGKIKGWFGTCTDVDEFVNIRSELAHTQRQFEAILRGADVLIWAIDRELNFTFVEGTHRTSFMEHFFPGGQVVGSSMREAWPESPLYPAIDNVLLGQEASSVVQWVVEAKEKRFYRCTISPLTSTAFDGSAFIEGAVIVSTDVTDLNEAHEQLSRSYQESTALRASEEAAIAASRLKSEFVANISHEIRTPIAGMIGMAELLLGDDTLSDAHRVAIGKIMRSGEILLEMVGMVLDMGKVEAGKLDLESRPFRLEDVIADARLFSMSASKKGLTFTEDIAYTFQDILMGDMPRLRQVISNLLSNAIKFTRMGSVTLRVHQQDETATVVRVRFEVEDTGVGIKEEAVPFLFQPFHQADASTARMFGGTGLGICIAKNLVELMGGTIKLTTKYGVGTRMTVEVPLQKGPLSMNSPSSPAPAPLNIMPSSVDRENTWILVTDDNELNREILTKLLTKMRFNVESATNGLEAIEALERRHFDLVLMDGQMPVLDGESATIRIRQSPKPEISKVVVIALTASAIAGDRERFIAAGMNGYLSKPVRAKALEAAIVEHLSARRPQLPPSSPPLVESPTSPSSKFQSSFSTDTGIIAATSPTPASSDFSPDPNGIIGRRRPSHPSYSPKAL
ncbi:hypothetical protein T439DRAFT_360678 [Meredithblackwellia eburnea MCA 4105]